MNENLRAENRMLKEQLEIIVNENKQLKGILQEIYERAINTNITSLDFRDYVLEILGDKE